MLLQHSVLYALARGIPGVVNFLALSIYTRLLSPGAYGQYAVVIAGIGLMDSIIFHWLRSGLLRFLPAQHDHPQALLSTILIAFLFIVALTSAVGACVYLLWIDTVWHSYIPLAVALLWALAWFELNLELVRSRLAPLRYGIMSMLKATLALAIGSLLILWHYNASGPLLGLLAGTLISSLGLAGHEWKGVRLQMINKQQLVDLLRYGLPLTATFALTFMINSSDRFLITWFLGSREAGLYAPGYDLAQYSLGVLMMIVNLAAYPLIIHAMEQEGGAAAQHQLRKNALLLLTVSLPAAVGLVVCATNIAGIALGEAFRQTAVILIPWITLASLIAGFKAFYLDLSFQLGRYTMGQVWVALFAAGINLLLNLYWIPRIGILGAAYATVVAYTAGFILSWYLGRRVFVLPAPPPESGKVLLASLIMAVALWPTLNASGWVVLFGQIMLGITTYSLSLLLLNVAGSRQRLFHLLSIKYGTSR